MLSRAPRFSRSLNWSAEEKTGLLNLVERYKSFIENKDCDSLSHKRRSEAWVAIARDFSVVFAPAREPQKMKEQYQRMKSLARKILAKHATLIIQGGFKEGDEARENLEKIPKWVDRIISIIPRDFQEYCKIIKPSDFSDSDHFVIEIGEKLEEPFENGSQSNLSILSSSTLVENQWDDDVPADEADLPTVHQKIENNVQQEMQSQVEERLHGSENHLIDENDTASVTSNTNVNNSIPRPHQDFSSFSRRSFNPGTSRKRKAPDPLKWTPETCSEHIQWEEHLQKMRHQDEEHFMKMEIMNLHKQILQQQVYHSVENPASAHNYLASSTQVFESLSRLSNSRNFIPLS